MQTKYNQLEISYVVPFYLNGTNADIFYELIATYSSYSEDLLRKIQFIFVDDGSPLKVSMPEGCKLNYQLLRVTRDIPWNQGGARNLGVHSAHTAKLVLTDLDHIFPEALLRKMLESKIPRHIYQFRREQEGEKIKLPPNILYCSKATFFKVLGVDEEFCGNYGYEDIFFIMLQKKMGTRFSRFSWRHRVILNDHKGKAEDYHSLKRDTKRNELLFKEKQAYLESNNPLQAHSRLFLNFPWEKVAERVE